MWWCGYLTLSIHIKGATHHIHEHWTARVLTRHKSLMSTEPAFYAYPFDAPFSEAVRIGDTLYLSGHIGDDDDGKLAQGFDAEVAQMMANVTASLARFDLELDALISIRVMLTDMSQLDRFHTLFAACFGDKPLPVCSAFGVTQLALDATVEIECVANL